MKDWNELKKELLKNPEFKKLYEESEPEYQIARAVIRARIEKGYTQKDLAKKLNTTQSVVSRLENAGSSSSISFLKRLAKALDTSLQVQFKNL